MAYDHTQYEVLVAQDIDLNSGAAVLGTWACGLTPHIIRGIAITVTNVIGAAGSLTFEVVTAAGAIDSGTDLDIIVIPNTTAVGQVIYANSDTSTWTAGTKITPGQEIIVHTEDVCAAGDTCNVHLLVEPQWEMPANNTVMTETG